MADNHIKFPLNNENMENVKEMAAADRLAADKNVFPDLHNEALHAAMQEVNKNENRDTQAALIEQVLKAKFFAPVDIIDADGNALEGHGKMEIPKDAKFNFKLIKNAQDEQYFALFTDIEEFQKWSGPAQIRTMVVVFPQMASLVMKRPDVLSGFVINPMGENIIFKQDALRAIIEIMNRTAEQMRKERADEDGPKIPPPMFAKADNIPDSVMDSLRKNLEKRPEVESACFCVMKENEKEYYLFTLAINGEGDSAKKTAESFVGTARLFLTKYPVIALPQNTPYGNAAKEIGGEFYTRQA